MPVQRPYIFYNLPASRTTQPLKGGKIEKVWENVTRFLMACTDADIKAPHNIDLTVFTADEEHGEDPELAAEIVEKAKNVFGNGETEPVSYLYPANIPSKQTKTDWRLKAHDLEKSIKYLIDGQPYPRYNLGPIELVIPYNFKLIDPVSRIELPNQHYESSILIWLSKNSCVSPSLCFPFTEPNQEFLDYLYSIIDFIPFKFDSKVLRLARSNKKGTATVFSKL